MTHNQIEFFSDRRTEILKRSINSGSGQELHAPIRRLQNCEIKQRESYHIIYDNGSHDVGKLWFDGQANTTVRLGYIEYSQEHASASR